VGYSYFSAPVAQNSLALNDTIKNVGPTSTYIKRHRVEGNNDGGASRIDNMGSGAMVFDPSYTPVSSANGPDGTTTVAQPAQGIYTDRGWDFTNVWKKGATDLYPVFQWQ
jgi:hypothetical protein